MKKQLKIALCFSMLLNTAYAQTGKVYWGDQDIDQIIRANTDGSGAEIISSVQNPSGIAINSPSGKMYFSETGDIYEADLANGANELRIVDNANQFTRRVAIDHLNQKIYWVNFSLGTVSWSNIDGSGAEDIVTGLSSPWAIDVDPINEKLYWSDTGSDKIQRANLDGSGVEDIITGEGWREGMALDIVNGKIYWTDIDADVIRRANLDGTQQEDVITTADVEMSAPASIKIDPVEGKLYWGDRSSDYIKRANIDGSMIEDVTAGIRPSAIALADLTDPIITSITRQDPIELNTDAASVTYRVTFSEPMLGVEADDFVLSGQASGSISITMVSDYRIYDVEGFSLTTPSSPCGFFDLDLDIFPVYDFMDLSGNLFSGTITMEESYAISEKVTPNVVTQNSTIQLDANGSATISAADINDGSNDNCTTDNDLTLTISGITTFDCSAIGTPQTVTLTVTDTNGNSGTADATVTVVDEMAPNVAVQDVTVSLDGNGAAMLTVADVNNGSSDNCTAEVDLILALTGKTTFDCSDVGAPQTVTLSVTDAHGNSETADATVTVVDEIAPNVAAQDVTVNLDDNGAAALTVADVNNGSSDNCTAEADLILALTGKATFDCSDVGVPQTVTLSVTDASGNMATDEVTITINESTACVTGIHVDEVKEWTFYPNPTDKVVLLRSDRLKNESVEFEIYNAQGNLVRIDNARPHLNQITVDFEGLGSGYYYLNVRLTNGTITHKIQIN